MEFRIIPRPTPVHSREFRTVRIDGQSVQPRSPAAAPAPSRPQEHARNPETRSDIAEDHRSAARARKAKRRLRRLFEQASRNAKSRARLGRADEYDILRCAYRAVRAWRRDGIQEEIGRELRAGAEVVVSRRSSLFLLLIRCALPRLEKMGEQMGCRAGVCRPAGNPVEQTTSLLVAGRWSGRGCACSG